MRVSVNVLASSSHAKKVCNALAYGIKASGDAAVVRTDRDFNMDGFDAAVFWGFTTECQKLVSKCEQGGIPWVYVDMAYWLRTSHYKVTVNNRHPDAYFMKRDMPHDRFKSFNLDIKPWAKNPDGPIVLAGMSGKAAWSWGYKAEDFERSIVDKLVRLTKRPIIYRPKPTWPDYKPIPGTKLSIGGDYSQLIANAHAVVSHHSNAGVDALVAGVPVFSRYGAALALGLHVDRELDRIETPAYPDGREQFAANLAYCQWSVDEMNNGKCWQHMKSLWSNT